MRANRTLRSLLSVTVTLGAAGVAFIVWHALWPAIIVGAVAGGVVSGLWVPLERHAGRREGLIWMAAAVVAGAAGIATYDAWQEIWLAILVSVIMAALMGVVLSFVAWLIRPTPVDLDAMLGGPGDIWWRLKDTADLVLELPAYARDITVRLTDQSDGLPELTGVTYMPRSSGMAPFQIAQEYMPYPETTSVSRSLVVR